MTQLIPQSSDGKGRSVVTTSAKLPALVRAAPVAAGTLVVAGVGLTVMGTWLPGVILLGSGLTLLTIALIRKVRAVEVSAAVAASLLEEPALREARQQIQRARFVEGAESRGDKLGDLVDNMWLRWKTFEKLIGQKFSPTEVTYGRYWAVAEATLRGHLANLRNAGELLTQWSLAARNTAQEGKALAASLQLEADERLQLGEKTLVEFDKLCAELARVETSAGSSAAALEATLQELRVLAERAQRYSHANLPKID